MMKWLLIATACIISLADGLATARPGPDSNYNIAISGGGGSFSLTAAGNTGSATTGTGSISYAVTWGSGCNAVVFEIFWYNTTTTNVVSSITGITGATQIAGVANNDGNNTGESIDMWQYNSPVGTSATITVNFSGNVTFNSNVTTYCLVSAHTTPTSSSSTAGFACNAVTPITGSVTVPSGGVAIAMATAGSGSVISWTNATSDTGSPYTGGGTQDAWARVAATATVSSTPSGADRCTLGWAAWGP